MLQNPQQLQQAIHRALLLAVMLLLVTVEWSRGYNYEVDRSVCLYEKRYIVVEHPRLKGCEPITIEVGACHGSCRSYSIVQILPPYRQTECNCCGPTAHVLKRTKLYFKCEGHAKPVEQKILYPHIEEDQCGCGPCDLIY